MGERASACGIESAFCWVGFLGVVWATAWPPERDARRSAPARPGTLTRPVASKAKLSLPSACSTKVSNGIPWDLRQTDSAP